MQKIKWDTIWRVLNSIRVWLCWCNLTGRHYQPTQLWMFEMQGIILKRLVYILPPTYTEQTPNRTFWCSYYPEHCCNSFLLSVEHTSRPHTWLENKNSSPWNLCCYIAVIPTHMLFFRRPCELLNCDHLLICNHDFCLGDIVVAHWLFLSDIQVDCAWCLIMCAADTASALLRQLSAPLIYLPT